MNQLSNVFGRIIFHLQGVETASQIRYVTYYEKLLSCQGKNLSWIPEDWVQIKAPDIAQLKLKSIRISGNLQESYLGSGKFCDYYS